MEADHTRTEMETEKQTPSATITVTFIRSEEEAPASTSSSTKTGWPKDIAARDTRRATTTLSHNTFPLAASPLTCKASSIGTPATGNSTLSLLGSSRLALNPSQLVSHTRPLTLHPAYRSHSQQQPPAEHHHTLSTGTLVMGDLLQEPRQLTYIQPAGPSP